MARLAGVDIPRDKRVVIALTYIYGIGRTRSNEVLAATESIGNPFSGPAAVVAIQHRGHGIDAQAIDVAYERMLKSDVKYRFVIDCATMGA